MRTLFYFCYAQMMSTKHAVLFLIVCLALVLPAGCGSSSDESTVGSLSKGQFIAQGDQICQKAHQRREEVFKKLIAENGNKPPLDQAEKEDIVVNDVLPPWEEMAEELSDLGTPKGEEAEAEAVVDGYQEAVDAIREDPAAALEGTGANFTEADKLAKQYGFKVCPST